MKNLKEQIETFQQNFTKQLNAAQTEHDLEQVRIAFLGRKGKIVPLMAAMKALPVEEKRTFGPLLNQLKKSTEQKLIQKKETLLKTAQKSASESQKEFDVSAYKPDTQPSSLHVYTHIMERLKDIFISMGYDIADGPQAETDYFNFQALNIPQDHPARDMQDTFWLNVPGMLLRTHTSPIQVREMKDKGAPIALAALGTVYRNEATDASHEFMFNQIEGLFINKNVSMSHLLATVKTFLRELFQKDDLNIRVRPSYFPFVEPGVEIDCSCPFCTDGCSVCGQTTWIELMGAGLVHPNVLQHGGIDPKEYSGFAFGCGIERIAMIKYGIGDIRLFHGNSVDFLKQF